MRKYSPPPKFDRHGYCECEQGTLYVSNQYFLPLYLCSSCGFAGHDTEKRTIDTECETPERKMHLNLIERMWDWLGVRAPKAVSSDKASNEYQSVMRDAAAVVKRWRQEKGSEKKW